LLSLLVYKKWGYFKDTVHPKIFFVTFITVLIYYLIYPRHVPEYYFIPLTPINVLYVSALFISLWKYKYSRIVPIIFLLIFLMANQRIVTSSVSAGNLRNKEAIVREIANHQKGDKNFSVSYVMDFGLQYGYQYFFTLLNFEPSNEIKPPIYTIVYPKDRVTDKKMSFESGSYGLIYPEDDN
jgi:hypothetical protein